MKGIILSAGCGKRLRPLTDVVPKPLVPIINRPVISLIIRKLADFGIKEIGINLHYKQSLLKEYLLKEDFGVKLCLVCEEEILGTGGGIANFKEFLAGEEDFLVHNGDILSDFDLQEALEFHRQKKSIATLVMTNYPRINTVMVSSDGFVLDISNKLKRSIPLSKMLTFSGIAFYQTAILDELVSGQNSSIIDVFLKLMAEDSSKIAAFYPEKHYWQDVGSVCSYLQIHEDILLKRIFKPHGVTIPEKPVIMGHNSKLEDGFQVRGFLSVGSNCYLAKEVNLASSVVWDNNQLNGYLKEERVVITDGLVVKE